VLADRMETRMNRQQGIKQEKERPSFWQRMFGRSLKEKEIDEDIGKMYIIVGLGNPTAQYMGTRHNVGFDAIDALAHEHNIAVEQQKHRAYIGKGVIAGQKVILAKPQTYMNRSGEAVFSLVDYYKVDESQKLIVIYDDVSLSVGQIRIRKQGSAGGQKGMKSIISHLGSQEFLRIRIGIGEKPPRMNLADYVLSHFSREEKELLFDSYEAAIKAVETILAGDVDGAMNKWNRKKAVE